MNTAQILDLDISSSKDARFDTKINSGIKELLKDASMLEGVDLSSFVISAATQKAREVIGHAESITLNSDEYKKFLQIISNPPKASADLKDLMKLEDLNER